MPGFDGTGPMGMGPMTGGGRGFCRWYGAPGWWGVGGYAPWIRPWFATPYWGAPWWIPRGAGRGGIPWGGGRGRAWGGGRGWFARRWW